MSPEKTKIDEKFLEILSLHTAGSPVDEDIKWTNLTLNQICEKMTEANAPVTRYQAKQLLKRHKFVRRTMRKSRTMKEVKNRNKQFIKIAKLRKEYEDAGDPIISIDSKKKEYIGDFYREGSFYGTVPQYVYDHDFNSFADGVVIPHGIYDVRRNEGHITIGTSKDTSEFCCDNLEKWWLEIGKLHYPNAIRLLVLCDGGGSNSSRHYIFKEDLQKLSNKLGIKIRIAHYPPYTSKYNPIEHRMFCHVTRACLGVVFSSVEIVKDLIAQTKTTTGLRVTVSINDKVYKTKRKYSKGFKENMKIRFDEVLGCWNYYAFPIP